MIKLQNILLLVFIMHTGLQAMGRECEGQIFSAAKRFEQLSVSADTAQSHAAEAGTSAVAAENRMGQTEAFLRHNPTFMGEENINPEDYQKMSQRVREVEEAHPDHYSFISGISQPWYLAFKFVRELLKRRNIEAFPGWELAICAPSNIVEQGARTLVEGKQHYRSRLNVDYSFPGQWRDGSPFDVFLKNYEVRDCVYDICNYLGEWLKQIKTVQAKDIDLVSLYVKMRLAEIEAATDSERDCVLQLLVGKNVVDQHVYLGQHGGYSYPASCYFINLTPGGTLHFDTGEISPFLKMLTDSTECEKVSCFLPKAWPQVVLHRGLFAKDAGIETCVHTEFSEECKTRIEEAIQKLVDDITHFSVNKVFGDVKHYCLHARNVKIRNRAVSVLDNMVCSGVFLDEIFSLLGELIKDEDGCVRANVVDVCTNLIEKDYKIDDVEKLVNSANLAWPCGQSVETFEETLRKIRRKGASGRR